jgi:hypothetical protein
MLFAAVLVLSFVPFTIVRHCRADDHQVDPALPAHLEAADATSKLSPHCPPLLAQSPG